uniref:Inositol oxygenase n=1 Tax=Spodoptera frugiperda TaxID=7108 RepID=A0A2H1WYT8_SPOFR
MRISGCSCKSFNTRKTKICCVRYVQCVRYRPVNAYLNSNTHSNPVSLFNTHILVSSTEYGMYEPHCGLDNLLISWSHDEYMYQFLKHNNSKIPEKGLYMIRYHSLYPWHAGGDYRHLTNEKDEQILQWVLEFNKYDLYTKSTKVPDIEALWPYYEKLIDKYIPGVCEW